MCELFCCHKQRLYPNLSLSHTNLWSSHQRRMKIHMSEIWGAVVVERATWFQILTSSKKWSLVNLQQVLGGLSHPRDWWNRIVWALTLSELLVNSFYGSEVSRDVDFAHTDCFSAVQLLKWFSAGEFFIISLRLSSSLETLLFVPALCIFKKSPTQIHSRYYDRNLFSRVMNKTW